MEIYQLQYFVIVTEELNISKSALRMNISQPALSRAIRSLEEELGVSLFIRGNSGVTITPAGIKLLSYARNMLVLYAQAIQDVRGLATGKQPLVVGFMSSFNGDYLTKALEKFRLCCPGNNIIINEFAPSQQINALKQKKIDLVLLDNPCSVVELNFVTETLYLSDIEIAVSHEHAAHKSSSIALDRLKNEQFIGYDERYFPMRNNWIINICEEVGFTPNFVAQAKSIPEMFTLIGAGLGIAVITVDSAALAHPNTVFIPISNDRKSIKIVAAWRKDDQRAALKLLVTCLKSAIIDKY